MLLTRASLQGERHIRTDSEEMEKIFHKNRHNKKMRVEQYSDQKTQSLYKAIMKDKEGYYIMIKELVQEDDIILIIIYTLNTGTHKYIK